MSPERVYRAALLSYPAAWRQERAEEVLGVLMAAGPSRARASEALSLVRHGLRERLSRPPRPGVWRMSTAAAAMATATVLAVTGVHGVLQLAGDALYFVGEGSEGVYVDPLSPVWVLWLLTFALLVWRRGRAAAVVSCAASVAYAGLAAWSWTPVEDPGGGPLLGLQILWDRLDLLVPTVLLSALLLRPGAAASARDAIGGRTLAWAFGVGAVAGLLDVFGGISDAWPALLALLVTLGSFVMRGLSLRAVVLVLLGFVYIPLGGLTDGSGSRLPDQPLALGLTLLALPVAGALVALLVVRLSDGPEVRGVLAGLLDRAAASLRSGPVAQESGEEPTGAGSRDADS